MRAFTPEETGYTWEDWEAEVRAKHPVRFWLVQTLPRFFRPVWWSFRDAWYWLKCHTLSSYRYHLVDLRNVDPLQPYTHGHLDPCSIMRLAAWRALRDYVEKAGPVDPASWATPEELLEPSLKEQKAHYDEAQALYRWWMWERIEEDAVVSALHELVMVPGISKSDMRARRKAWLDRADLADQKDEEMLQRLFKLRSFLWT